MQICPYDGNIIHGESIKRYTNERGLSERIGLQQTMSKFRGNFKPVNVILSYRFKDKLSSSKECKISFRARMHFQTLESVLFVSLLSFKCK